LSSSLLEAPTATTSTMASEKIQPWKAHWTPQSGNPNAVAYQEKKGFEIIADGGSAGPPAEEGFSTGAKNEPISAENRLCPHLLPITNPTLKKEMRILSIRNSEREDSFIIGC